jgi:TonB family protein
MKNIGKNLISSVCALTLVVNGFAGVMAQDRKKGAPVQTVATIVDMVAITARRSDGGAPRAPEASDGAWQSADSAFQFFSQEKSFDDRLVTGAPFSADVASETIQTLGDGTRIVQRFEGRLYRDSKGRTRSERTYQMGGTSEQKQIINIYDPVDGASYRLDSDTRTGRKSVYPKLARPLQPKTPVSTSASVNAKDSRKGNAPRVTPGEALRKIQPHYPAIAKAANASGPVPVGILVSETGEVLEAHAVGGHPLLRDAAVQAARGWMFKPTEISGKAVKTRGILTFNFELTDEAPAPAGLTETYVSPSGLTKTIVKPATKTEGLGKQMVEGVECEGERAVTTMPVGTIGNDRPIETVNETWYSPELKVMILSKRSDPRFGESTYSVTNITRSEPYAELFLPPSDYKLIDSESKKQITLDLKEIEEMRRKIKELQKRIERSRKPDEQ